MSEGDNLLLSGNDDESDTYFNTKTIFMEVHQHQHTERKKWTHYFWEFFMLFLAITAGFFVENLRELYIEKHREKQFIRSIAEDLRLDIHNMDSLIDARNRRMEMIDSLTLLLKTPNPDEYGNEVYYYARWLTYSLMFINNDRTIQQLKNGGNLRLIRNQEVSNKIMDYDQQFRFVLVVHERENSILLDYIKSLRTLFDSGEFDRMLKKGTGFNKPTDNPKLLSKEKAKLQELQGIIHFLKATNTYLLSWLNQQEKRAHTTLDIINKDYHLE